VSEARHLLWDLMRVGELLRILQQITNEDRADGVCEYIIELRDSLNDLQLEKSAECAEDWLSIILEDLETRLKVNPKVDVSGWTDDLKDIAKDLMSIIRNEANARSVFVVPKDKYINVERLIDDPLKVLCSDVAPEFDVPLYAQEDLKEAAECYAIGRFGATIIFSLRATEALLRDYYCKVTKGKLPETPFWNNLARDLGSSEFSCEHAVLHRLNLLRERRNEAMHAGPRIVKEWDDRAARKVMRDFGKLLAAMYRDYASRARDHTLAQHHEVAKLEIGYE
jgi:hypothetical protein